MKLYERVIHQNNKYLLTPTTYFLDTIGEERTLMFPRMFSLWQGAWRPYFEIDEQTNPSSGAVEQVPRQIRPLYLKDEAVGDQIEAFIGRCSELIDRLAPAEHVRNSGPLREVLKAMRHPLRHQLINYKLHGVQSILNKHFYEI